MLFCTLVGNNIWMCYRLRKIGERVRRQSNFPSSTARANKIAFALCIFSSAFNFFWRILLIWINKWEPDLEWWGYLWKGELQLLPNIFILLGVAKNPSTTIVWIVYTFSKVYVLWAKKGLNYITTYFFCTNASDSFKFQHPLRLGVEKRKSTSSENEYTYPGFLCFRDSQTLSCRENNIWTCKKIQQDWWIKLQGRRID